MKYLPICALLLLSPLAYVQAQEGSLQQLIAGIGGFINEVLIPFILGIAFLIFLINAVRFFVIGGDNTESQENARSLALYGVGAFVLILSLWGMVNLLANGIGLNEGPCIDGKAVQSDYLYGVNSNAPCSSVRPQARPPALTKPPVTTPVVRPPAVGSNPNGTTGTSFTPNGEPLTYGKAAGSLAGLRVISLNYLDKEMATNYGKNAQVVKDALFFGEPKPADSQPGNEIEKAKFAYRLLRSGAISQTVFDNYIKDINDFALTNNKPDAVVTSAQYNVIRQPLPDSVKTNIKKSQDVIAAAVLNTQPKSVVSQLFDQTIPAETRLQQFNLIHSSMSDTTGSIKADYIANLNTEMAFNGVFRQAQ